MKLVVEKPSPLAATQLVVCEMVRGRDFGCVWHHHPECELTLVLRGGTERFVGDNLTRLNPGDLVFLGSNLPHDYRNQTSSGARATPVEAIVVQFMPNLLGEEWLKRASMESVGRLFQNSQRGLQILGPTRDAVEVLMKAIAKSKGVRRMIHLLEIIELLAGSRHLAQISSSGFHADHNSTSSDRIGKVCEYISQHLSESLYVPELARSCGLSESGFSRLFKQCTGRTIPQYVNEMRIARSCRLLAETDQTVSEISYACGYVSPAHFQRQFQSLQKRSPLAYRRAARGVSVTSPPQGNETPHKA